MNAVRLQWEWSAVPQLFPYSQWHWLNAATADERREKANGQTTPKGCSGTLQLPAENAPNKPTAGHSPKGAQQWLKNPGQGFCWTMDQEPGNFWLKGNCKAQECADKPAVGACHNANSSVGVVRSHHRLAKLGSAWALFIRWAWRDVYILPGSCG
jgi:hypothetical protein